MKILIVIDLQKGFMENECCINLSFKIKDLLKKVKYDKIIFTKFVNYDNSMYEKYINWSGLKNQEEQDFTIDLPNKAEVWEKTTYGLSEIDLEKIINLNPKSVDICGLQTDACVYAISFQLFDHGIFPNILINYTATEPEKMAYSKQMLIHQFGKVDETIF